MQEILNAIREHKETSKQTGFLKTKHNMPLKRECCLKNCRQVTLTILTNMGVAFENKDFASPALSSTRPDQLYQIQS